MKARVLGSCTCHVRWTIKYIERLRTVTRETKIDGDKDRRGWVKKYRKVKIA